MDESSSENEGSIVLSMDSEDGNITRTKTVNINGEQQEDTTNIPFENKKIPFNFFKKKGTLYA
jgi:hypothetical protein